MASDDGKNFGFGGLLEVNDLPRGRNGREGKIPHTFVLKNLRAEGRFVKVLMQPGRSQHLFLDEIEVIAPAGPTTVRTSNKLRQVSDSGQLISAVESQLQLKEKVAITIEKVAKCRNRLGVDFRTSVLSQLEQLAANFAPPINELFSADKLSVFDKNLGVIRAKIYRQIYNKPYVCVPANAMGVLKEADMLISGTAGDSELSIGLWQAEYESAAINIINCTDETMSMRVSISPLITPEGVTVDSKETVTIRRAVFVNAACVGSIADALVLQNEKPFELEAGSFAQIWLTIF